MSSMSRDLNVKINGDPANFEAALVRVRTKLTAAEREMRAAERDQRARNMAHAAALREAEAHEALFAKKTQEAADARAAAHKKAGQVIITSATAVAAGLAYSTKKAMDWQSAFAGVRKTVDATPEQLEKIERGLRDLAGVLPATHGEIAAVAEAAGQLGVKQGDVVEFTRVMLDMGETTNLSATDAATGLAKFSNVMGTAREDTERMGSTIVALGNNSATTEGDILGLAQRLAAAAKQANLTEADVFAFASTLTSVGVEAEAGGTAFSKVFTSIGDAVRDGNSNLEVFAKTAGMSVEEFSTAFRTDAAGAINAWLAGMGRAAQAGESTTEIFKTLGLEDSRLKAAVLSTGQAQGLLADQLDLASTAWAENNALANEAGQRYETAESKIALAKNTLNDVAIDLGATFLPMVADAAEGVADLAKWVGGLPEPLKGVAAGVGAVAAGMGLLTGGLILGLPKWMAFRREMDLLKTASPGAATGVGKLGKAMKIATGAMVAYVVAQEALDAITPKLSQGTKELQANLRGLATDGGKVADVFADVKGNWVAGGAEFDLSTIEGLGDALKVIADPNVLQSAQTGLKKVLTIHDNSQAGQLEEKLELIGSELGTLAERDLPAAATQFTGLYNAAGATDEAGLRLLKTMPDLKDALIGVADSNGMATDDATLLALALGQVQPAAQVAAEKAEQLAVAQEEAAAASEEAAKAQEEWRQSMLESADSFTSLLGGYDEVIAAHKEWAEGQAAGTKDATDSWEDFYDGVEVGIDEWIGKLREQVKAQESWSDNILTLSERVNTTLTGDMRDAANEMIDELWNAGPEGAAAVATLVGASDKELRKFVKLGYLRGDELAEKLVSGVEGHRAPVVTLETDTKGAESDLERFINRVSVIPVKVPVKVAPQQVAGHAEGGRLGSNVYPIRGYAGGGRLPGVPPTDPTVDNLLASDGRTLYRVRSGEWVINGRASDRNDRILGMINAGADIQGMLDGILGYASGGRVDEARSDQAAAKRTVEAAASKVKAKRRAVTAAEKAVTQAQDVARDAKGAAKKAAQSDVRAAQKTAKAEKDRLADAEKALAEARKLHDASRQRSARLDEQTRDLQTDVRRGNIRDQVTSGLDGGLGLVDRALEQSRNTDLSKKQRANLRTVGEQAERDLTRLYGDAEKVKKDLDEAQARADQLSQIADQVSSGLKGEQSLASSLGQKTPWGHDKPVTAQTLVADAQARAAKIRSFATKLQTLAKMGLSGVILQEVAGLGSEKGTQVADALIRGGAGEINNLNKAYADIDLWSRAAGQNVTEGFYQGGVEAANGIVKGLESKQVDLERSILAVGISVEHAFKKALGIASPSKVTTKIGEQTGEGIIVGHERKLGGIEASANRLALASVPSVPRVNSLIDLPAASGAGGGVSASAIDAMVLDALSRAQIYVSNTVGVDRPSAAEITRMGMQERARSDRLSMQREVGMTA